MNPDEARHVNHWALIMRLLQAGFPYEVIIDMKEPDIVVILATLGAIQKKREEDNQ